MIDGSKLIAHRGESSRYPENTLSALKAAIDAGTRHIEFDVQFSHDTIPVVFHDLYLERATGMGGKIIDYSVDRLSAMRVNGAPHRDVPFLDTTIPTLNRVIELLNQNPEVTAYVEIKQQGFDYFGLERCTDCVIEAMMPARFPWVLISFAHDAIRYARTRYPVKIGWVLHEFSDDARMQARELDPAYLFCNVKRLPQTDRPFWQGPWQWVIYDIDDPHHAQSLLHQGADMIETSCITKFLNTMITHTGDRIKRLVANEIREE